LQSAGGPSAARSPRSSARPPATARSDVVIEAVGSEDAWHDALALVRPGGTVLFFGGREASVDTFRLHYEELTLRGAFHHTPAKVRAALAFLASGAHPWERLITHEVGLDGVATLLADPPPDYLKAGRVSMKTLTARELNRSLLARQLLLERSPKSVIQAIEAVGGLQTQNATGGYVGLWTRLKKFDMADLTKALEDRRAVQGTMMRITIHLVSAGDYPLVAAGRGRAVVPPGCAITRDARRRQT
jgi:hypothetical protein